MFQENTMCSRKMLCVEAWAKHFKKTDSGQTALPSRQAGSWKNVSAETWQPSMKMYPRRYIREDVPRKMDSLIPIGWP